MTDVKVTPANIGVSSDVVCANGYMYTISNRSGGHGGSLVIYSLEKAAKPALVGRLDHLGELRQIAVYGTAALVTARADGLLIIDVSEPSAPKLLIRYDTVEYATAIAIGAHYAFIGCRSYGIEAIDITDAAHPEHVCYIHAGEVQSMAYADGLLATGSWGENKSMLFDVSDITHPKKLSEVDLGGHGDGVFIRGNMLLAATGQFPKGIDYSNPEDPGYGMGNGLDIFDITDPTAPVLLSSTNFGFKSYYPGFDMWSVYSAGSYAYMGHTFNGVFVYDITDPAKPVLVNRTTFPIYKGDPNFWNMFTSDTKKFRMPVVPFDNTKVSYSPVTGIAVCDGVLYAATGRSDLYVLESELFQTPQYDDKGGIGPVRGGFYENNPLNDLGELELHAVPGADVHDIIPVGDKLYAAGGLAGILVLDAASGSVLSRAETEAAVLDIGVSGEYLYAAETNRCMSVWHMEGGGLTRIAELDSRGLAVRQVVVSENGRFVMLHIAAKRFWVVNVSDPYHPVLELEEQRPIGLVYERQLSVDALDGRYYNCFWQGSHSEWIDTAGEHAVMSGYHQWHMGFQYGVTPCADVEHPHRFLATTSTGYALLDLEEDVSLREVEDIIALFPGLRGKPRIFGNTLFISDKTENRLHRVDISDIRAPKLLKSYRFASFIGNVWEKDGFIYIAAGRQGYACCRL